MNIKQGCIYLARLDPALGGEIKKTRPVLVVSNNINNKFNATVTILPLTSNVAKCYPFEVIVQSESTGLPKDSKIKADQIRTIDKSRIIKKIGKVHPETLLKVMDAIKVHLSIL
jgi:mRNA interferase MazF